MTVRALDPGQPRRILVRGTNWVGDAVMTLPALETLAGLCPQAQITVLAKPMLAALYQAQPVVDRVIELEDPGPHAGLAGMRRLARGLEREGFDWAVLLQNAFHAAALAWLAHIPVRLGYARDGRGLLLSHGIVCGKAARTRHETSYYLGLLHGAGLLRQAPSPEGVWPRLALDPYDEAWAEEFLRQQGLDQAGPILGLAPGAAFGPAKCWPPERFAEAGRGLLKQGFSAALLFGGAAEASVTAQVAAQMGSLPVLDMAGRTGLGQALALLARLGLFVTNDSGLMHACAALGRPTLAIFGSTNPVTTAPLGPRVAWLRKPVECSPCLKPVCPTGMRCFTSISAPEVVEAALALLAEPDRPRGEWS